MNSRCHACTLFCWKTTILYIQAMIHSDLVNDITLINLDGSAFVYLDIDKTQKR